VAVALDVAVELGVPPAAVVFRPGAVLRARVPEAAVDIHRDPEPREDEVGASAQPGKWGSVDVVAASATVELAA
jgi:hypothetical protein